MLTLQKYVIISFRRIFLNSTLTINIVLLNSRFVSPYGYQASNNRTKKLIRSECEPPMKSPRRYTAKINTVRRFYDSYSSSTKSPRIRLCMTNSLVTTRVLLFFRASPSLETLFLFPLPEPPNTILSAARTFSSPLTPSFDS